MTLSSSSFPLNPRITEESWKLIYDNISKDTAKPEANKIPHVLIFLGAFDITADELQVLFDGIKDRQPPLKHTIYWIKKQEFDSKYFLEIRQEFTYIENCEEEPIWQSIRHAVDDIVRENKDGINEEIDKEVDAAFNNSQIPICVRACLTKEKIKSSLLENIINMLFSVAKQQNALEQLVIFHANFSDIFLQIMKHLPPSLASLVECKLVKFNFEEKLEPKKLMLRRKIEEMLKQNTIIFQKEEIICREPEFLAKAIFNRMQGALELSCTEHRNINAESLTHFCTALTHCLIK